MITEVTSITSTSVWAWPQATWVDTRRGDGKVKWDLNIKFKSEEDGCSIVIACLERAAVWPWVIPTKVLVFYGLLGPVDHDSSKN